MEGLSRETIEVKKRNNKQLLFPLEVAVSSRLYMTIDVLDQSRRPPKTKNRPINSLSLEE